MKRFFLFSVCLLVLVSLGACKSKQPCVRESVTYIDSSRVYADSQAVKVTATDTSTTIIKRDQWLRIDFTDSCGSVSVDKDGNIILHKVKGIHGGSSINAQEHKNISVIKDTSTNTKASQNAIKANQNKDPDPDPDPAKLKTKKEAGSSNTWVTFGIVVLVIAILLGVSRYMEKKKNKAI